MNVRQAHCAAAKRIGEPGVVETEEVEQRRVQIVDVNAVFNGVWPENSIYLKQREIIPRMARKLDLSETAGDNPWRGR